MVALDKDLFSSGNIGLIPAGDAARQAVDSLRGYAYQVTAAALAWLDLGERERLYLEVAEDYSVLARQAIEAVQVKDTAGSGNVTLNSASVRSAISDFLILRERNPELNARLRYFTTSEIGLEKLDCDRPNGTRGLIYWRRAAAGAPVGPLRSILDSDKFPIEVREFVRCRSDMAVRDDLLRRIHWDCGKPDISALRREFIERLVVVAREVFAVPAPEAMRLSEMLIYRVLQRSIEPKSTDRVLTRGYLYSSIDQATLVSMPRATADLAALVATGLGGLANASLQVASSQPNWLVRGQSLPIPKRLLPRPGIEDGIVDRLSRYGGAMVFGASGLGKSSVARAATRRLNSDFVILEFRGVSPEETRARLELALSRIGGLEARSVIFEDLNHFSDPRVTLSASVLLEALRRRDCAIIITCYRSASTRSLSDAGLDQGCLIECPYFTEEESSELVSLYGGDPKLWGRIAYMAGAIGHPQLVHAFAAGASARGWPKSEIKEIVYRGLSSGDIDIERETARRSLIAEMPDHARSLLYRLSLVIGRFRRRTALAVAATAPPIGSAGEYLDILLGPWIETVGPDMYRVSPLAALSGQGTLALSEQINIHNAIASDLLAAGNINASDADSIILHALLGKNAGALVGLAMSILTARERSRVLLAEYVTAFKLFRTDALLYPDNRFISSLLRLAQFELLSAAGEAEAAGKCASALFSEIEDQSQDETYWPLLTMSIMKVLGVIGVAGYVDNWLSLLEKFDGLTTADEFLRDMREKFEQDQGNKTPNMVGTLFAVGSANISSVARLEYLVDQLSNSESSRRSLYFEALAAYAPDYAVFVNLPWTAEYEAGTLNASDVVKRYRRMATKTASWGIRKLTIQCWIAQAVMFDEYEDDREGALAVLDEARRELGEDVLLARAKAKIYWRSHDYAAALSILIEIADEVGRDNKIERAFALREAAISAAKTGDWSKAETWFLEGELAAKQSDLPDMMVMAAGLKADAAVAAIMCGAFARGIGGLAAALTQLMSIDPNSSLRAVYCHQVVRHVALWMQARLSKVDVQIDGRPISIDPGVCSNPEPSKAIADRPLAPMDIAWYFLADAEVASGENVGIADHLADHLSGGPILVMESELRTRRARKAIADIDPDRFVRSLWPLVEAVVYLSKHRQLLMGANAIDPVRGAIPVVSHADVSDAGVSEIAKDAIFAFAIAAACRYDAERLFELEGRLRSEFNNAIPCGALVSRLVADRSPIALSFDEGLADSASWFKGDRHADPSAYFIAGLRFFQQAVTSIFSRLLVPMVADWQRSAWTRIVISETFRLSRPLNTVPDVKRALSLPDNDEQFLANLILATATATGMALPLKMQADLERQAQTKTAGSSDPAVTQTLRAKPTPRDAT